MKEYEVRVTATIENVFYVEAENEDEAKDKAQSMASSEIEKYGMRVDDIEEIDVGEC